MIDPSRRNSLGMRYRLNQYKCYDQLIGPYADFSEYSRIIDLQQEKEARPTKTAISFQKESLLPYRYKIQKFQKSKGSSFKLRIKNRNFPISITFHKISIGGYKIRLEMHSHKGEMFYYKYTFTDQLNQQKQEAILKIVQEKYLDPSSADGEMQNIIDEDQNLIVIENVMELRIHYICTRSSAYQTLLNHRRTTTNRRLKALDRIQHELRRQL